MPGFTGEGEKGRNAPFRNGRTDGRNGTSERPPVFSPHDITKDNYRGRVPMTVSERRRLCSLQVTDVLFHFSPSPFLLSTRHEGPNSQEVRRRNPAAREGVENGAAAGDQARTRAGGSAGERRIPCGEGTPAARRVADQPVEEARQRHPPHEPREG